MSRYVFFHQKKTHTHLHQPPTRCQPHTVVGPEILALPWQPAGRGHGTVTKRLAGKDGRFDPDLLKWSYKNSTPKKWLKINEKLHWGYFTLVVGAQNSEGPYHVQHGIMENEASECFFSNRDKLGRTANPPKQDVYKLHPRNGWP